jgi:hypothetical protein
VLPYASYLRVYEPITALGDIVGAWRVESEHGQPSSTATLAVEQRSTLSRIVTSPAPPIEREQPSEAYVLHREGEAFYCPVDLSLRSWLSFTSLVETIGDTAVRLIFPAQALAIAGEEVLRWRRDHPGAVPHIRQTTWGVPRTWFVMVVEDERERYDDGAGPSVRYRARILDARRRLAAAHRLLTSVIDDTAVLEELAGLSSWLEEFDESSWVELDYAGIARLLGEALLHDQSARDIHRAIDALRRDDYASAGASYRAFEERWRVVNAFERAN